MTHRVRLFAPLSLLLLMAGCQKGTRHHDNAQSAGSAGVSATAGGGGAPTGGTAPAPAGAGGITGGTSPVPGGEGGSVAGAWQSGAGGATGGTSPMPGGEGGSVAGAWQSGAGGATGGSAPAPGGEGGSVGGSELAGEGGILGGSGAAPVGEGGAVVESWGGLVPNTTPEAQDIDLFGLPGHRLYAEVSEAQLASLNEREDYYGGWYDDIYVPGQSGAAGAFLDHLVVRDVATGSVADYGKVEAKLVGQSTYRPWNADSIPNLKVDMDEFQDGLRLGGEEHFRLNNGQVGTIFREQLTQRIIRALGYPASRSTHAFLGSNVWGEGIWVPMVLTELYKGKFCRDRAEEIGGECLSLWEMDWQGNNCKLAECESNLIVDVYPDRIAEAPQGDGFAAALDDLIDWSRFHQFQCLSWMLWIGDDTLHNSNNTIVVERDDGRLVWLPYSVDISLGQEWYQNTPLYSNSHPVALGCQRDADCWAETIATCESLIADFNALQPELLLDETRETLTDLGMMRRGDDRRADEIRQWLVDRQANLMSELDEFRNPQGNGGCPRGQERCVDGSCGTHEECVERNCTDSDAWCESSQSCFDPTGEEDPEVPMCPECPEATPLWCEVSRTCVTDLWVCSEQCRGGDYYYEPLQYCPYFRSCQYVWDPCPGQQGGYYYWDEYYPRLDPIAEEKAAVVTYAP
ncbi:MAG: hypothetical protein JW751_15520 [Polyangiaceae bacterium]|nr:hypothetical protein [Polyangiaceae bacterium]